MKTQVNAHDRVTIRELESLLAQSHKSFQDATNFAAFGMTATETIREGEVQMPGAMFMIPGNPTVEMLRGHFSEWLACIALRESITRYSTFLEDLGLIAYLASLGGQKARQREKKKKKDELNRLFFPQKIDFIEKITGKPISADLKEDLLSVNKTRNCLEHGQGIVRRKDSPQGSLDLTWKALELFEETEDGVLHVIPSREYVFKGGTALGSAIARRQMSFQENSTIKLSGAQVYEIGMSLSVGMIALVRHVMKWKSPDAWNATYTCRADVHIEHNQKPGLHVQLTIDYDFYPECGGVSPLTGLLASTFPLDEGSEGKTK